MVSDLQRFPGIRNSARLTACGTLQHPPFPSRMISYCDTKCRMAKVSIVPDICLVKHLDLRRKENVMVKLVELDEHVMFRQQIDFDVAPAIVITRFCVPHDCVEAFLKAWKADAAIRSEAPGFISAQLLRGVGSNVFLNYAVWGSAAAYRKMVSRAGLTSEGTYPPGTRISPHLYEKATTSGF